MSDLREALERERRRFRMPEGSPEDLERRRDRRRRNRRIVSGVVAFTVAAVGAFAAFAAFRDTGEGPRPAVSPPVATDSPEPTVLSPTPSSRLQFLDANNGWMAAGPEILATKDGGWSWARRFVAKEWISGLQFVDPEHGWATSTTQLWRTTDGGANWENVGNEILTSFQFLTPEIGWGIEGGHEESVGLLVKTSDGGETWASQNLQVNSLCFQEGYGWATGPSPRGVSLYQTVDEGKNWTLSHLPVPRDGSPYDATVKCSGIDAWVLLTGEGATGHISYALFRTKGEGSAETEAVLQDRFIRLLGGENRRVPLSEDPTPGPLSVYGGLTARFITWCLPCGPTVAIMRTTTAGDYWKRFELPREIQGEPIGVSFVEEDLRDNLGYTGEDAVGWLAVAGTLRNAEDDTTNVFVLKTSDGGETWTQVSAVRYYG